MWFRVYDYPKFVSQTKSWTWQDDFKDAGFKTYKFDYINEHHHWLDDYEYTFFVLRYS
jgi:hypothetical protein